jgi:hypothetical protein
VPDEKDPTTLTLGETQWPGDGTVRNARIPIAPALAQEILDYLFEKKQWHDDVNVVHAKVRQWRTRIKEEAAAARRTAPVPPVAPLEGWQDRAFALRHPVAGEPMSWREVAKAVAMPLTSVRRAVAAMEAEREPAEATP